MERLDDIRSVLALANRAGLSEVELVQPGLRFVATFDPFAELPEETHDQGPAVAESDSHSIAAGYVGYFQSVEPAIGVGAKVNPGDVIGRISALGLLNDVESDCEGEIVTTMVQPGEAVQYGQPLFHVRLGS